jgi:nucleoside-diphosphate-sugar epimerase
VSVALVTGAAGQVGSHVVERLLADGWTVRALARDPARATRDLPNPVEVHHGDVLDQPSFVRAAQGVHVVFHAAANIMVNGWDAFRITNIEGTRNAIEAAASAKARLLQVSSVAVYGPSARYDAAKRGEKTDETTVLAPLSERAHYARSKRDSEELVLRAHREGRVWATAVRPDVIYGRRDRHFVPRMVTLLRFGAIPLLKGGRTTMAIVHAQNVAEGCVLAATSDIAGGKAYNLANDYDVSVRRFFELGGEGIGSRPRFLPLPMWLAEGAIRGVRSVTRALTGSSLVNFAALSFLSEDNPFSSERAKRELGWAPTMRPEVGVPDAFIWALENKRARQ